MTRLLPALLIVAIATFLQFEILVLVIWLLRLGPTPDTEPHWARCLMIPRSPDMTTGPPDNLYLRRWYLIPHNRWYNLYLHQFLRSDDDRALHDHPWWNVSVVLRGAYVEVTHYGRRTIWPFRPVCRLAAAAHRVELIARRPVWSLFITGPKQREWGFHCPNGWRHWTQYVAVRPGGNALGRGCE
jgi:hypothetical protein